MKSLLVVLLALSCSFISGCVLDYNPNSRLPPENPFRALTWNADGSRIFAIVDSFATGTSYRIKEYDKDGNLLQSFPQPEELSYWSGRFIWGTNDDSTFYFTSRRDFYRVNKYNPANGLISEIAGGTVYGISPDRNHVFIGPYGQSSGSSIQNDFLILDVSTSKTRLQKSWQSAVPSYYYYSGAWLGNSSVGYFRYNQLNLVDFVIVDTNGVRVDSFDVPFSRRNETRIYHGNGNILFATPDSLIQFDSVTRTFKTLIKDYFIESSVSSDGTFIVYSTGGYYGGSPLFVINTKTGVSKMLTGQASGLVAISPANDHVAYLDNSDSKTYKLTVIPVSAP